MPDVVMQVDVAANRDILKDALTTHAGITGWWTEKAEVPSGAGGILKPSFLQAPLPFDLRVMAAGDEGVVWRTESFPPHWVGTEVRFDLSDVPDASGTRVLFSHIGFQPGDTDSAGSAYTWGQLLARLKEYAETGRAQPYFTH